MQTTWMQTTWVPLLVWSCCLLSIMIWSELGPPVPVAAIRCDCTVFELIVKLQVGSYSNIATNLGQVIFDVIDSFNLVVSHRSSCYWWWQLGRSCSSRLATKIALRQSSGTSKRQRHMPFFMGKIRWFDVMHWKESAEDFSPFEEVVQLSQSSFKIAPKFRVTFSLSRDLCAGEQTS